MQDLTGFYNRCSTDQRLTPHPVAQEALQRIAALYKVEDQIRGKPPEERRAVSQAESKPLLDPQLKIPHPLPDLPPQLSHPRQLTISARHVMYSSKLRLNVWISDHWLLVSQPRRSLNASRPVLLRSRLNPFSPD